MTVMPYTSQLADCCSTTTTEFGETLYVMAEWFGAAADGVTDDSDAFIRALADGRPIGLAANKTYALKNITITADMGCPGVFSLGGQARIVPPPAYVQNDLVFVVNKANGFVVENIFFDMPKNEDPNGTYAFRRAITLAPSGFRGSHYRVENCRFSGAEKAISSVGYIVQDSRFAGNYVTGTFGDGFSFNAVINVEIVDNLFENGGFAAGALQPSGAIRTGTNTQLDSSLNLTIARNTITRYSIAAGQSAIDCFSGAARNIRITDNICSYNGAGIELKTKIWTAPTPAPPGSTDSYDHNVVADNTIRLFSDRQTGGISVFHADPGAPKGKAQYVHITGNMISSTGDVNPIGVFAHVGIYVSGHDNVLIDGNFILNCGQGIGVDGRGPVGDTADNIVISNNTVDTAGGAIVRSGGTVNKIYIRNNPLLRASAQELGATVAMNVGACDELEISGNFIEAYATYALEVRGATNVRITDNTIKAIDYAVISQGDPVNGVMVRDNELISTNGPAITFGTGSNITIRGNDIDVPIGARAVEGAATYTAADNVRGMATANPTGTAAGSIGDIFLDSTGATAGWRCTAAGNPGVWTVI